MDRGTIFLHSPAVTSVAPGCQGHPRGHVQSSQPARENDMGEHTGVLISRPEGDPHHIHSNPLARIQLCKVTPTSPWRLENVV